MKYSAAINPFFWNAESTMHSEIRALYRSFLRLQKLWPSQSERRVEFKQILAREIRSRFRRSPVEKLDEDLMKGRQELRSLESLLSNRIEKQVIFLY